MLAWFELHIYLINFSFFLEMRTTYSNETKKQTKNYLHYLANVNKRRFESKNEENQA